MIKLLLTFFAFALAQGPVQNPFDSALAWQPKTNLQQSFDADFMVMMATMFPQSDLALRKAGPGYQSAVDRQNFVKRLYLLLLLNPPKFRQEKAELKEARYDNATQSVSYLMRGRRWMVDFTGIPAEDVVKFLSGGTSIVQKRTAASHGARITKDGQIIEVKLSGLKSIHAVVYGLLGRHLGVNIPLGGYGNYAINNSYRIGPDGTPIDQNGSKTQHGHVYLYAQTYGKKPDLRSVLLIGIEPAGPGYKSMFNVVHNAASARKDSTLDPSLTNSKKWRHSGIAFQPADYNGMLTSMDIHAILQWENACKKFLSLPINVQQRFMAKWLRQPAKSLVDRHEEVMKDIFDASRQDDEKPALFSQQQVQPQLPMKPPQLVRPKLPRNIVRAPRVVQHPAA